MTECRVQRVVFSKEFLELGPPIHPLPPLLPSLVLNRGSWRVWGEGGGWQYTQSSPGFNQKHKISNFDEKCSFLPPVQDILDSLDLKITGLSSHKLQDGSKKASALDQNKLRKKPGNKFKTKWLKIPLIKIKIINIYVG